MQRIAWLGLALSTVAFAGGNDQVFRSGFEDGEVAAAKSGLGTNLEVVEDFSAAYSFTNLFKQSRPWITAAPGGCPLDSDADSSSSCFDTNEAAQLDLDADGWVQSLPACDGNAPNFCFARTVINSSGADYPNGQWLVTYEGEGTLTYSGAASLQSRAPGRDLINVNSDGIIVITLESTAAAPGHLKNIQVLPPGFDPAQATVPTFHPDFIAALAPYRTLRFMDWMRTNGIEVSGIKLQNDQVNFAQRPVPSDAHWTRPGGVPLEVMIELANQIDAEPWFTLPHQVSDDYVREFARTVKQQLDAGREVYVEHSNEVWNGAFPQGLTIQQDGVASLLPVGCTAADNPSDPNCPSNFTIRMNQHGLRTAQICALFREVYAEAPSRPASEIICTLGAQAANSFTATEAADCPLAVAAGLRNTPCSDEIDAVAIAPYFGNYLDVAANADEIELWDLDDLFAEINTGGQLAQNESTPCTDNGSTFSGRVSGGRCTVPALEEITAWIAAQKAAADARSLRLVAYEGGQHLVGVGGVENNNAITALFTAANRDARMGTAYGDYLQSWKDGGGELFVHFNLSFGYGKFGSWGVLESLNPATPTPPKAQAILDFNAANPCWWTGCGTGGSSPPPPPPPSCPQPLLDSSLEATAWSSTSQRFGSVLCTTGTCPDDAGTALPRAGSGWAWFGGTLDGQHQETSTLSQSVTIPSGSARHLNFFLRRGFVGAPLTATLEVRVDGVSQRSFDEPATAESAYVARSIDLSAFADGAAHSIEFRYVNPADGGKSNFTVDDITLDCSASGS